MGWLSAVGGWAIAAFCLYFIVRLVVYVRSRPVLYEANSPAAADDDAPRVCVIVPACDEAAAVERCLRSLVTQDYPNLHVIAVNDRSTDSTGELMERVATDSDRLSVLHVTDLPANWLGKNHANHLGVSHASADDADYFLFTDGDVVFKPDCVSRAMAVAVRERISLLSLFPDLARGGYFEEAMCLFFGLCYLLKTKAWSVANPNRLSAFAGVGAFNLIERGAYERAGGHERLRMEVADDYKLGKIVKLAGGRCALLDSDGGMSVRWQVGLRGVVRGMEKNAFAGADYSLAAMAYTVGAMVGVFLLPWAMLPVASGVGWWGWLAACAGPLAALAWLAKRNGWPLSLVLMSPVCAVAMAWACVRATWLALVRGGIVWRGTFYSLDALKRGMV